MQQGDLVLQVANIPGPDVYLAAAYWSLTAITTIGFGDILPITNAERAVMLLVEVLGVLFFGILLGSITSLLQVSCHITSAVLCCAVYVPCVDAKAQCCFVLVMLAIFHDGKPGRQL